MDTEIQADGTESRRDLLETRLPDRYLIKGEGEERGLVCREAPTLKVRVQRGFALTAAAARKAEPGSIFLDGAAQGGPFLDTERQILNLDHHDGCVRSFTLSTCEQAMVLVRKGLDLRARDWTIYANEPDLDTLFAIWILLNHIHLGKDEKEISGTIMPLIRLQGAIDALGLEMMDLSGFPPDLQAGSFSQLEQLRAKELDLKREGLWHQIDFLGYTADLMREIDALVYSSEHFEGILEVEELARSTIASRWLAMAVSSAAGIYEVEQHLRKLHGNRLGIIALQKSPGTYTLRQVESFLPATLEAVYERLNLIDPAAGGSASGNRWGGSTEIGGSPRASGSRLSPKQVVEACSRAYQKINLIRRLVTVAESVGASAAVMLGAGAVIYVLGSLGEDPEVLRTMFVSRSGLFGGLTLALGLILLLLSVRHGPGFYGLRRPFGKLGWAFLPLAWVGTLGGGAWCPEMGLKAASAAGYGLVLVYALAAEILFRGLVQGILVQDFPLKAGTRRWTLSVPVMFSTVLYALWTSVPVLPLVSNGPWYVLPSALLFGLACALARERAESLLVPVSFHILCLVSYIALYRRIGDPLQYLGVVR